MIRFARSVRRFKINEIILVMMHVLVCRESGLDCDFVIKGETLEGVLKVGANHEIEKTWYARRRLLLTRYPGESVLSFL